MTLTLTPEEQQILDYFEGKTGVVPVFGVFPKAGVLIQRLISRVTELETGMERIMTVSIHTKPGWYQGDGDPGEVIDRIDPAWEIAEEALKHDSG